MAQQHNKELDDILVALDLDVPHDNDYQCVRKVEVAVGNLSTTRAFIDDSGTPFKYCLKRVSNTLQRVLVTDAYMFDNSHGELASCGPLTEENLLASLVHSQMACAALGEGKGKKELLEIIDKLDERMALHTSIIRYYGTY